MQDFSFEKMRGRRTLILGDTGAGKTRLTASILREAVASEGPDSVTVLDFAPQKRELSSRQAGGRIVDLAPDLTHLCRFSNSIRAPRLEGRSREEVREIAERNAEVTTVMIRAYLDSPTPCLFINDMSIHLHAGATQPLLGALHRSRTFVGNSYLGSSLDHDMGSGVSRRERELVMMIGEEMDSIIELTPTGGLAK